MFLAGLVSVYGTYASSYVQFYSFMITVKHKNRKNQQMKTALLLFTFSTVALSTNILDIDSIHVHFQSNLAKASFY